ncbi:Yip1-domain-containing protein [Cantharellus anzutake]|uniref:Yip1-domain-containing protein n=1 Tax=Cantharellus anzutake TaxID=1750568 RepID=UPI0019062A53|nr:Yip1-domain-containing protein [Cantharellus anzutake]KAF8327595.1 Yip1-domain-containing protein [Cantharellus anzutake]
MSYQTLEADDFKSFLGDNSSQNTLSQNASQPSRGYLQSEGLSSPPWTVEYYQKYFDVDTKTVLSRCYHTLNPFSHPPSSVYSSPDLYGPFWTLTTVIFSLFVFSSLASSISSYLSDKPWDYDFKLLGVAVGLVYSYGIGVPVALWGILKWVGGGDAEWSLLEAINAWGYGMTAWIPVSVLCIIPVPVLRWTLVGIAFGLSGTFLVRNVYPVLSSVPQKSVQLILPILLIFHIAIAITFKLLFFSYYIVKEIGPGAGDSGAGKGS